ncbi:putative bifunctional diguanylate cyclase/phosphodiesterase [Kurthia sibirica]|uniref:GGDEF domain-containing protein n=1 Tax=Kurthia sibirica TaxID=202750 RepID=A0A2U3AN45_9BACL|nr:EAL domain-containing protein [Kurthia sibirica]PWI25947.1 GGDEF domain-containing protein [Kurthia sibirica]GEK35151.1 GGDEF domain-containing protein [Kurthia sibirica]
MDNLMNATASLLHSSYENNKIMQDIITAIDQSVVVAITNEKGIILSVNKQFCRVSQYSALELIGQDHRILNSGYHSSLFFKDLWKTIGMGHMWEGEICNRAKDGSLYWVQTKIVPFLNEEGNPYQYISIRTDITEQKNAQKFRHLAYHDELTGLENRRKLKITYDAMKKRARQLGYDSDRSLILLSINRFKQINVGYGYKIGDLFLIEVAEKLRMLVASDGQVYHYLGDQFAIICKNNQRQQLVDLILELFNAMFQIGNYEFYSSISIGIRPSILQVETFEEVIRTADIALTKAKEDTSNNAVEFDLTMKVTFNEYILLEKKLRHALENNLFELYYQPKFDVKTRAVRDVEALLRWFDGELGWIPPDSFIPLAEQLGLMTKIGEFVLRSACHQAVAWKDELGIAIKIAVNISPLHLKDKNFVSSIQSILQETGCTADLIEIEITENSLLSQTELMIETFAKLKKLGISIALDDFGKGYSSLSYLKNFPIDTLKIDRDFIMGMTENSSESRMVIAIIGLARIFNMTVVAEGVETLTECTIIENANCDYMQGFFFSKPLPLEEVACLFKKEGWPN